MALFKRADSKFYWLEFTFAGQRYRVSTQSNRIGAARKFERAFRQQVYDQTKLGRRPHQPMTFADAVRRYASTHLLTRAKLDKSSRASAYCLAALTRFVGPDTVLDRITTERVASIKEAIFDGGRRKPATVNKYLADLRAILRMAHYEWQQLGQLPRFKLFPLKNERTRWLREDEEARLLKAAAAQPHLHDLIIFLIECGARLSEACRLTWEDVILPVDELGTVMLFASKTQTHRAVPLTTKCDRLLRSLHAIRPDNQPRVFLIRHSGGTWRNALPKIAPFTNPHGAWKTAITRADLHDVHLHDLRHTFASRLVQRNISLHTVAMLLGHTNTRMTARYAHLSTKSLRDAIDRLDTKEEAKLCSHRLLAIASSR